MMPRQMTIMSLEEVLYEMEGAAADESKRLATREKRDPEQVLREHVWHP
jgi:hypothetical protein